MAQLPSTLWLIQQIGGQVILFHRDTEDEVVRFNPADANAAAKAQHTIYLDPRLSDEDKCFAHFWAGYFYAYACMPCQPEGT